MIRLFLLDHRYSNNSPPEVVAAEQQKLNDVTTALENLQQQKVNSVYNLRSCEGGLDESGTISLCSNV